MINALLVYYIVAMCTPDISHVRENQVELHPVLGVVIALDDNRLVAYPTYPPVYVQQCNYFIKKDTFNLTFKFCYGNMLYILGEPTMWKDVGSTDWNSMDHYPCKKGG